MSAGLGKMSPPSPVVSGRQHSVGKCTHMLFTSHICFKHTSYFSILSQEISFFVQLHRLDWIRGGGWEIPSSPLPRGHTVWNCVMLVFRRRPYGTLRNKSWMEREGRRWMFAIAVCRGMETMRLPPVTSHVWRGLHLGSPGL